MGNEARRARLLAFFNRLTNGDKDLVLKISEVIQKEKQGVTGERTETGITIKASNSDNHAKFIRQ